MARRAVFLSEHVPGIRGLAALTEPEPDEPVAGIVDVAVIGARGDGKTQFIVHAIRTLRAYGPALAGAEAQHHREIMKVVLDARAPRPDATAPGVVPHYVFRIRPAALLAGLGAAGRTGLLARATALPWLAGVAALAGAAAVGGAAALGAPVDAAAVAGAGIAGVGAALARAAAGRRFARGDELEVVFWDVAGEHVYSPDAAAYHAFLDTLVRERRRRAGARRYAFAPVLLCNPLGLGVEREGSPYHRLRQVVPLFASIGDAGRVLVAVNRWSLVDALCEPDADRDEVVAVVERRRAARDAAGAGAGAGDAVGVAPAVRRDVVRAWCRDAEDGVDDDVRITHLRYDAGTRCAVRALDEAPGATATTTAPPARALEYRWEDGPGAFTGDARRVFLGWLADLAYRAPGPAAAHAPDAGPPALAPLGESSPDVWRRRAQES